MTIRQIIEAIEADLPLWLQEEYDNCGLQVGDVDQEATGALLCVDVTEDVIYEAVQMGCNLIVAHHPLLFKGLKRIGTSSYIERCVSLALKADLCIYAAHTNADNAPRGLNAYLAQDLGLMHTRPLEPLVGKLTELVTYVPKDHLTAVQEAVWGAGAGRIGAYDSCSFSHEGVGTFRALSGASPFVGQKGQLHHEAEERLSVIFPSADTHSVVSAMLSAHPYETPAYSLYSLKNDYLSAGSGIVGNLIEPLDLDVFLESVKAYFKTDKLSYTPLGQGDEPRVVQRIAICSGSGAFLWRAARRAGAEVFITGEAKYNDYFDVETNPILVTVGHYESEEVCVRVFRDIISHKFPNFALHNSKLNSNPIKSI